VYHYKAELAGFRVEVMHIDLSSGLTKIFIKCTHFVLFILLKDLVKMRAKRLTPMHIVFWFMFIDQLYSPKVDFCSI